MNTIVRLMLASMLMIVAAPGYSAVATQMWRCELGEGTTEADVKAKAGKWLEAARQMKGGEGLDAYVFFPVAVNNAENIDLLFVVTAPSFSDWGQFWDAYQTPGSPMEALDKENQDAIVCPDSAVWESYKVE